MYAFLGCAPAHGIRHDLAHGAFAKAAGGAFAIQVRGGAADNLLAQRLHRSGQFFNLRQDFGVLFNRLVQQDRFAFPRGRHAGLVKGNGQLAQVFAIGFGRDDQYRVAFGRLHHGRIGAGGRFVGVGKQRVAVTAHDHVDAGDGCGQRLVVDIADVRQQHDFVDTLLGQRSDHRFD